MQNITGKLMKRFVAGSVRMTYKGETYFPKARRVQSSQKNLGKHCQIRIQRLRRIPENERILAVEVDMEDEYNKAKFKLLNELLARSSTPGKKGCHAAWKLDLHSPTTDSGPSIGSPCPQPFTMSAQRDWWM